MSLLKTMTRPEGFDVETEERPVPGEGLGIAGTVLTSQLSSLAVGAVRNGGGYGAAIGVGEAVCAAAGINPMLDLAVVGACCFHCAQRAWEGWTWHREGGRAAVRRRRKYQGEATFLEVARTLSPAAAAKKMQRLAPSLPAELSFIPIGHTVHRPRQQVAVSRAESIGVFGVPQSLKTALISSWILEAPGCVLATSSRADQYRHTVTEREKMGTVLTLDADGFGPGTNFAWSPVAGCEDPEVAMRRAGDLMHAAPRDPGGKDRWHEQRGAVLLYQALHAAALAGRDMFTVRQWVQQPDGHEEFLKTLLREDAAPGWAQALEALTAGEPDYVMSAVSSADSALTWMDSPRLAAVACPQANGEPAPGLDIAAFLREGRGSVYLIGSEKPYGSLTPFFSVFVTEFLEQARILAECQGGKLPVPLLIAADEAATTAKIDLRRWLAVTAGYNITTVAGFQAFSQIEEGWGGQAAADVILQLLSTKVIAGGFTSASALEALSFVCGERSTWHRERGVKILGDRKSVV